VSGVGEAARAWYSAGCCVLPAAADGTKKPGVGSWDRFKAERPSEAILEGWLANADGIGMVCGAVSGNIEMLELEGAAVQASMHVDLRGMLDAVDPNLWAKLNTYSEYTPGGGLHWIFRVVGVPVYGNTKLARQPREPTEEDPSRVQTLIETRGEGGWTVLAPSGGKTHPTGKPWVILAGEPGVVGTLYEDEYELLHEVCRALDGMPIPAAQAPSQATTSKPGELAPGEDYNSRASWEDVLTPAGWRVIYRRGEVTYWQRPGKKDRTISASTGHQGDWLYVFTTSTEFESERTYTKFGAYAVLSHHGDHAAAAKQLRKDGYGSPTAYTDNVLTLIPGGASQTAPDDPLLLVEQAVRAVAGEEDSSAISVSLTDDGNAQLLVMREQERLHYNPQRGEWLHWTGGRWQWDSDDTAAIQATRDIIRGIIPANDQVQKHKNKSLSKRAIFDAVKLAARDPQIQVSLTDLDADPYALNTPGGVVNLISGEVTPPTPEALHTRMALYAPDYDRVPERWLKFLAETFQEAQQPGKMIEFVQRLAGYSATGRVTHHVLPFCHGSGGNGKTVFLEVLLALLGDYGGVAPADFLLAGKDVHESYTADLAGRRLVVCSEIPQTAKFNEQKIKNLTGGDSLQGRFLYGKPFRFTPSHHLWLLGNHQPRVDAGGESFWRRLRLIPFLHEVPEDEVIVGLADELVAEEGPAILAWVIAGAKWQKQGLKEPAEVKSATTEYAVEEDAIGRFLAEMVRFGGGKHVRINTKAMRSAYESWCFTEGIKNPLAVSPFGRELKARGIEKLPSNGQNFYINVTLMNRDDPSDLIERPEQTTWYEK
jgi:P4 family phage/plasmid primase-like protien